MRNEKIKYMDLRDYREMPDEGVFEKVERRVRRRRMVRMGGAVSFVVVAIAAIVWLSDGREQVAKKNEIGEMKDAASYQLPDTGHADLEVGNENVDTKDATSNQQPVTSYTDLVNSGEQVEMRNEKREMKDATSYRLPTTGYTEVHLPQNDAKPPVSVSMDELILEDEVASEEPEQAVSGKSEEPSTGATQYENVLWSPNVLIPSDEDEANRVFKVVSTSTVQDFYMVIFNRGGRQVFSSNDIHRGWDGTHDGVAMPQGTYVWVARFRDTEGVLRQEKGTVTVVR